MGSEVFYCRRGHALEGDNVQVFHDQHTGKDYLRCRECQRRYSRNWRETHKEEVREKSKLWMRERRKRMREGALSNAG